MRQTTGQQKKKKALYYAGLLIVGLLLGFAMLQNLAGEFAPYLWKKTGCVIRKAEIVKPEPESQHYNFSVSYDYEFEGNRFSNRPAQFPVWARRAGGPKTQLERGLPVRKDL